MLLQLCVGDSTEDKKQHLITFVKALKSAKPPPNDSLPNTAANGSETYEHLQVTEHIIL